MARLIDADLLLENYNLKNADKSNPEGYDTLMKYEVADMIEDAPTVEAVPVVHGEWLLKHVGHGHYWECSVCHANPCIYVTKDTKFCPNCGAKMD